MMRRTANMVLIIRNPPTKVSEGQSQMAASPGTPTITTIRGSQLRMNDPLLRGTGTSLAIFVAPFEPKYEPQRHREHREKTHREETSVARRFCISPPFLSL